MSSQSMHNLKQNDIGVFRSEKPLKCPLFAGFVQQNGLTLVPAFAQQRVSASYGVRLMQVLLYVVSCAARVSIGGYVWNKWKGWGTRVSG